MNKAATPRAEERPAENQRTRAEQVTEANPDGTNATIHHPDPDAQDHPVRPERKPRFSYTTGNW